MTEESSLIVQGTAASVAVAFLQGAILRLIPYATPALMLIILDLIYGVRAAKHKGERVRFSSAFRRTLMKTFSYIVWLILASTLALAFKHEWLEWGVLAFVYLNEFMSILGNMLEVKGVDLSIADLWKLIIRKGGEKVGVDVSKEELDEVLKPKRDSKGRFVKKEVKHE